MVAVTPRIKRMLKILEPTMLPSAMSGSRLRAATTEVDSSGRLVPTATSVRPMISSGTPKPRASEVAPATSS